MTSTYESDTIALRFIVANKISVGKTTLINYVTKDDLFSDDTCISTVGVDFKMTCEMMDNVKVKMMIWKEPIFRGGRFFLESFRHKDGALLVFDVTNRESFKQTEYMLDSITDYKKYPIPFILVGNKADFQDDDPERVISKEEGEHLADRFGIPYIETSAKTGFNVRQAFLKLAAMAKMEKERQREEKH